MNKNPVIIFLLGLFPGLGHLYLHRYFRAVIYGVGSIGSVALGLLVTITVHLNGYALVAGLIVGGVIWLVNIIDILITTSIYFKQQQQIEVNSKEITPPIDTHNERFFTIILSCIPGLGHLYLGLMYRGVTLLAGFFGLGIMILFVTILSHQRGFLVFLGALPIVWLINISDIVRLLHRKQNGERLEDRTIWEDIDSHRETGKKSKITASMLAIFPGAGHMYLSLQRRGLQIMAGFLFSIYILDVLHLSIFLFIVPIIWFYSFFDTLQYISKYQNGETNLPDVPVIEGLMNHQKWLGIGFIALGLFYLIDHTFVDIAQRLFPEKKIFFWYQKYFQTTLVSILLIFGGFRLMWQNNRKKG